MPAVRRWALGAGLVAAIYVGFSLVVAANALRATDRSVAAAFQVIYDPSLLLAFRAVALLGGLELTSLLALALFAYLWRQGYRRGAFAAAALPLATLVELIYKRSIHHPGPPLSISHPDGPSLSDLLTRPGGIEWSFPSGHMTRSVVVYGLVAFIVLRLAERAWLRRLVPVLAAALLLLIAFDRLYLEVHWESDVIGGLLLGATFLAASVTWLEWSEAKPG